MRRATLIAAAALAGCLLAGTAMAPTAAAEPTTTAGSGSPPAVPCAPGSSKRSPEQPTQVRTTIIRGTATEESVSSIPAGADGSSVPCRPAPAK